MLRACKGFGMRPVCDHPSYCKNDAGAMYIGQQQHLGLYKHLTFHGVQHCGFVEHNSPRAEFAAAYAPHRNNPSFMPGGFTAIKDKWDGLCSYTARANKDKALCNIPTNTHTWKTPRQANPGVSTDLPAVPYI